MSHSEHEAVEGPDPVNSGPQSGSERPVDRWAVARTSASLFPGRSLRRWSLALLGVLSVGVGFVGVFVPGLPTTIFLILASYCFTRSCPWLEERLVRAPIFRPYQQYLQGERKMPRRARIVTIAMIWIASGVSCFLLYVRGALGLWFVLTVGVAALIGSVVVTRIFRGDGR